MDFISRQEGNPDIGTRSICAWDGITYGARMWCQRHLKDNLNMCPSRSPEWWTLNRKQWNCKWGQQGREHSLKRQKREDWSIETNSLWHFPNLPIDCEGMVVSSGFYPEAAVSLRDVWIVPPRTEQHNACRTNVGISGLILNQTAKDAPKPNCRHSYHQLKEYLGVCTPFIS